jgi:hypothetical protein
MANVEDSVMRAFWNRSTEHCDPSSLARLGDWLRRLGAGQPAEPEEAWLGWDGWVCTDCRR